MLVLVRRDNSTAGSYAKFGAGRVPHLTQLARSKKELEVSLRCTVVALHIAGKRNSIAYALSCVPLQVCGSDAYPEGESRYKLRQEISERCGVIHVDMLASDDGPNAWGPVFRPPSGSALEGS